MAVTWKAVARLPGYEVSTSGRIRRVVPRGNGKGVGELRGSMNNNGYLMVARPDRSKRFAIHRLICEAFHGPPPSRRHHAAHRDGVKTNNRSRNLRWATPKENSADSMLHGTVARGSQQKNAKLRERDIVPIFRMATRGAQQRDIARHFGVHQAQVFKVLHRISWRHVKVPTGLLYSRNLTVPT